nr:probable LRR receptor-like serine/threonine-protein kinase At1g07650 [Ipomoea trifida]
MLQIRSGQGTLSDGTVIAVKQLSAKSRQGYREFLNEIGMISCLQHPNLVKLYGCCVEGKPLLLVYEYMENNSLAQALFGPEDRQLKIDWATRQRICVGIAKGLAFLHEESTIKVVHRDIKTANVLLDKELNPKISDFGLAKLDDDEKTHISTRVAGTIGYTAPEYALWGYLTFKADVYSFGVVALEIVAGKNNMKFRPDENYVCLLDWALVLQEKGKVMELIDPRLGSDFDKEQALRMLEVALLCTNHSPALRPSMSTVVSMLEGNGDILEYKSDIRELNFQAIADALPQNSSMSASMFIILMPIILLSFNARFVEAQSGHLPPDESATNNFDAANKIGEGGFGSVYKGTLLDGTVIAVKQLSSKSSQGNREFLNEISIISCLQHPNLVKLYGCCAEGKHLLLVYEYLENNNLAHALFGYMAPEYALWGYLTFKADVYSFGVVTLEIVVGKNNVKYRSDDENCVCLLDWALDLQKKGNLIELMDPRLGSNYDKEGALRMIKVALLCANPSPVLRPSMSEVVKMLEGHDDILEYKSDLHEFNFQAMRDRYDEMTVRSSESSSKVGFSSSYAN